MSEHDTALKKKKLNLKGWWWKFPLILISLIWFLNTLVGREGGLPTCDSSRAKGTLTKAFDASSFARQLSLSVVEISDVKERTGTTKQQRNCSASVTMNNAKSASLIYKMNLRENGTYMLEFEVQE